MAHAHSTSEPLAHILESVVNQQQMIAEHTLIIINELTVVRGIHRIHREVYPKGLPYAPKLPCGCVWCEGHRTSGSVFTQELLTYSEIRFLTNLEFAKQARLCATELQA